MMWKKVPFHQVACYEAPSWARHLAIVPSHRVKLATLPTPIHEWRVPSSSKVPTGIQLSVKRDDLTGCALSGTKIRRLEFQLARAVSAGCRQVITCGYEQSNHIRATVVAARHLGLEPHVFVMSDRDAERCQAPGNWLFNMMCGARVTFLPRDSDFRDDVVPAMRRRAKELRHPSLVIAQGGTDIHGTFGSVECWREMLRQRVPENFDDVVVTCSSGGTVAGLALANHLTGCRVRLHAVMTADKNRFFIRHLREVARRSGLGDVGTDDLVDVIDGHVGAVTPDDLRAIRAVASGTGVLCDPIYTWKGLRGLLAELGANRERFRGDRILFLHTGGIFPLFDGTLRDCLAESFAQQTA